MIMKKIIMSVFFLLAIGVHAFAQSLLPNHLTPGLIEGQSLGYGAKKWETAFPLLKIEADKGNEAAQFDVACCYADGRGVAVNFQEAFNYIYKAATGKTPFEDAWIKLGFYYEEGIGCSQNYKEAMKWYRKGAEESAFMTIKRDGEVRIGLMYAFGNGVQKDEAQAKYWLRRAAEHGETFAAAYGLAMLYTYGSQKDEVEGVKWGRKAAESGLAMAQYYMGVVYLEGIGDTPINKSIALDWFKKAAAQGDTEALIKIVELEGK